MFYREAGQFKTTYGADQAVFPILQDQIFVAIWLALAFVLVPLISSEYLLRAILIPFLILALAALGLNLLVGYCGQLSLGTGGFMAVGAYAAYNLCVRIPALNPLVAFLLAGGVATLVGMTATVITPIPANGVGEIAYVQAGSRYSAPARNEREAPVASGQTVKIVRIVGTQFYVTPV